jgi:hypothetical protein
MNRAKKIGSDEYVKGSYIYDETHKRHFMIMNGIHGLTECLIDPLTLEISFDEGENWNTILEVKGIVGFQNAIKG